MITMLKPLTEEKLHAVLRSLGPGFVLPKYRTIVRWTPEYPTAGHCWVLAELVYKVLFTDKQRAVYKLYRLPFGRYNHYYLMSRDKSVVVDLSYEQFRGKLPPYERGVPAEFWPLLSLRGRKLTDLLGLKY